MIILQTSNKAMVSEDYIMDALKIKLITIYKYIREGHLAKPTYSGSKRLWKKSEIDRMVAEKFPNDAAAELPELVTSSYVRKLLHLTKNDLTLLLYHNALPPRARIVGRNYWIKTEIDDYEKRTRIIVQQAE